MAEKLISEKGSLERISLGIKGLDSNMEGGIPVNSCILVAGAAGTMKSTVCFNAIYQQALAGKRVLYITLEQSYISLLNQMINLGYDFQKVDITIIGSDPGIIRKKIMEINKSKKGHIIVTDLGSLRAALRTKTGPTGDWWYTIAKIVRTLRHDAGVSAVVLDSINSLYVLTDFKNPREKIFEIIRFFKEEEVTSFLVSEMPKSGNKYCQYEIEDFLVDGVIVINQIGRASCRERG